MWIHSQELPIDLLLEVLVYLTQKHGYADTHLGKHSCLFELLKDYRKWIY